MRKLLSGIIMLLVVIGGLAACGKDNQQGAADNDFELADLEVEFEVPETAEVGETVELKATVTYGEELVTDADEVVFEVWEKGKRDEGEMIEAENHEDGTYTAEVTFDRDGIFEMFAHTTARGAHTMPKKEVVVGEGGEYDEEHDHHGFHTEGFDMHFMELDEALPDQEVELITHITMNDEAFADLNVRYEIWNDDISEQHDWVDAKEANSGEYIGKHTFREAGTYTIQIHVEDDKDLHEHAEYEVEVNE